MPTKDEINEVLHQAEGDGASKWPGMTYEQGVAAAIRWIQGDGENPMSDD